MQLVAEYGLLYSHVSQRMGNSLCSQPALLMSAFGMLICECVDEGRESKSVKESQRMWRRKQSHSRPRLPNIYLVSTANTLWASSKR